MEKRIIVEEMSIHQAIIGEEMPIYQRINGEEIPIDLFPAPFPNGMRVLAIDYNVICLRILERMLQKCQYHVTTTTHALTALNILRENKDTFDIIISNVEMPDMDGFELLKIVGLEMDLPFIMLSAYNETKFVMNGVISGACDYLLKPVRLLELKNIWQHVVKKKFGTKDMKKSATLEKTCERTFEGGQGSSSRITDQNGEFNRKRKDQCDDNNIDDDDDEEEDGQKNEDQAYKKPRVVWSTDLHHKFVVAVNQLGIDKAVPKKILDLMNVDKLSRENVASHLQKYRIYMKKLSYMENHQENMMASLAGQDPSYLHTSAFDGLRGFHALTRMTEIPNALGSYPTSVMLGGLNTPVTFDFNGLSSRIVQHGHASTLTNFVYGHQNENLLNGVPIDQLQHNNSVSHVGDFSTTIDGSSIFTSSNFLNPGTPEAGNGVTSQSWFATNSSNTLEDLLNAMVKI